MMKGKKMPALKTILLVVVGLVILVSVSLKWLSSRPAVANNYTQTVKTGGGIEAKYLQNGTHEVSYKGGSRYAILREI